MTLVSVVIATKNRAPLLKEAIESVLAVQRHDFDLEVIVIDDGSTDDTASLVAQYPVTYIRTPHVKFASGSRNMGIAAAHGDFVTFLDDDDVWLPTNLTPQLQAFADQPTYGAVHGQVIMTGPDRMVWGEPEPAGPLSNGWIFYDVLDYWPQIGSVVVRRSVLQQIGGFDESLRSDAEDWDLVLRIARRWPIGRVETPALLFRQRGDDNEEHMHRSMVDTIRVFRRHARQEPLPRRLLLQRKVWRHRGWFAAQFVGHARANAERCDYRRARRSLTYALEASPPHALLKHPTFWSSLCACMVTWARRSLHP